jgi:EcsC protein family
MGPPNHWRRVPGELIARIRADPARAPEHIALAAADLHGPAAAAWVAKQHARGATNPVALARAAKRRHARLARVEGAATGLGGWTTAAADLVALAWIQSRLVFFVAAAYGYDPRDRMRPAELLVLTEVYSDVTAARDALDGAGRHMALAYAQSRLTGRGGRRDNRLLVSLAGFVGRHTADRGLGRFVPFVGAPINAVANELDTRRLADKAILFYGG